MIDFPASPTVGQQFTAAGANWTWDGVKWTVTGLAGSPFLPLAGGTMTGPLVLAADPTLSLGAATKQYVDALPVAMNDNRIINGDMRVNQRGITSGTAAGYTFDRWAYWPTQTSKITWSNAGNNNANGFPYCACMQTTSAYTPVASDTFQFQQPIEADWISDFAWGTPSAQPVTLSFWAQSSLNGAFSGSLMNSVSGSTNRSYPFSFSLPTANAWTKIVVTIPGDTSGTWTLTGNTIGLIVNFDLGTGLTGRGPAGAWASALYRGVTGAVSLVTAANATFYVTGVKLELGSVATPFNRQSLAKSLMDCQRYFEMSYDQGNVPGAITSNSAYLHATYQLANALNWAGHDVKFAVHKRAAPTITCYSNVTGASGVIRDAQNNVDITANTQVGRSSFWLMGTVTTSTVTINLQGHWTASAEL